MEKRSLIQLVQQDLIDLAKSDFYLCGLDIHSPPRLIFPIRVIEGADGLLPVKTKSSAT